MPRRAPEAGGPASPAEEKALIEAAQRDPSLFAKLYELHFERVYAYVARRVRGREEAEDLTAEAFYRALANLKGFEWRGLPFAAWLFRIAANAIADHARRSAREQWLSAPEDPPGGAFEDVGDRARLFRLVGELPEDQRRVIALRFAEDKTIREIAAEMRRTEGAVKQLQLRGLQNLRRRMGEAHG